MSACIYVHPLTYLITDFCPPVDDSGANFLMGYIRIQLF
jgi:hypothetical protein